MYTEEEIAAWLAKWGAELTDEAMKELRLIATSADDRYSEAMDEARYPEYR